MSIATVQIVERGEGIVFFDGDCGLCERVVRFILDRDQRGVFRFAPLQSPFAAAFFEQHGWHPDGLDTMVVYRAGRFHLRSDAAIAIARGLPGIWSLGAYFSPLPKPLRDGVYRWIAARRHRWFGKPGACRMLRPGEGVRFLG